MKRVGNLFERLVDLDNLLSAFWKAQRGKRGKGDVQAFRKYLHKNTQKMRSDLLSGDICIGDYHYFTINDPKERLICAASFKERVLHHALINVSEPFFESYLIYDSYACRKGKGVYNAISRAVDYSRKSRFYLKMDIRKYFDSIHHTTLKELMYRRFKDIKFLDILDRIVDSYAASPGRGIPIGNLTSQYFANHYLGVLDHYLKEELRCKKYVRYMDDFILWDNDKSILKHQKTKIELFLRNTLKLELKPICLNTTVSGFNFLGYRIFPNKILLTRQSRNRFFRKLKHYHTEYIKENMSEQEASRRILALLSYVKHARSDTFRRNVWLAIEGSVQGLEPRDTRRQLEQRCA